MKLLVDEVVGNSSRGDVRYTVVVENRGNVNQSENACELPWDRLKMSPVSLSIVAFFNFCLSPSFSLLFNPFHLHYSSLRCSHSRSFSFISRNGFFYISFVCLHGSFSFCCGDKVYRGSFRKTKSLQIKEAPSRVNVPVLFKWMASLLRSIVASVDQLSPRRLLFLSSFLCVLSLLFLDTNQDECVL